MRILLLSADYPPLVGGVADYTNRLAHALAGLGHEVSVLTSARATQAAAAPAGSASVQVIATVPSWGPAALLAIAQQVQAQAPQVVALQYVPTMYGRGGIAPGIALLPALLRRHTPARVVVTLHEVAVSWRLGPRRAAQATAQYAQMLALALGSHRVLVTNHRYARIVQRWTRARVTPQVLPVGANILPAGGDDPARSAVRQQLGIGEGPLLGSMSALGVGDQPAHLLTVLQRLPQARLVLLGGLPEHGARWSEVEALARRAGVVERVGRTGYWPPAALSRALATLDLFVHARDVGASTRSTALAAALAHALPIVAYRGIETSDLFADGENILLAPAGDARALAARAAQALASPALRARLRAGARRLYERHFSWERIAQQFLDVAA